MGEIARRAGISPATLYRRFESKNDLVAAVGVREAQLFIAEIDQRVREATAGTAAGNDHLVEIFVAFITQLANNKLLQRLLRTEPDIILPRLTTEAGPMLAVGRTYLADKLRALQVIGDVPAFDADLVAEVLARLGQSLVLTPDGLIPLTDETAAREFARRTILPMIGVQPV